MVPTDVVRWHNERIELTSNMTQADLERILHDRTRHLSETNSGRQLLVTWKVADGEFLTQPQGQPLAAHLRRGSLADALVDQLRRDFGMTSPGVWTVQLESTPPAELPAAWYEEDTILGDLLRLVRHYQEHDEEPLEVLSGPSSAAPLTPELVEAVRISEPQQRQEILRRVAILGVDLLRGEHVTGDR
jgi:hypothetical protein